MKMTINTKEIEFIKNITKGLNEEQALAVKAPVNSCTKIVAGAGTGKTKIISKRFIKLVHDLQCQNIQNPAERMLVITFTDKAATEMKERIFKELKENGYDHTGQELSISTFHGFCNSILRKHSIEAGLSPSFSLLEECELKKIFDNIIQKIKYGETSTMEELPEITKNLNIESDILEIQSINKLIKVDTADNILNSIYQTIKKIKAYGLSPRDFLQKTVISTAGYSKCIANIPFGFDSKETYATEWENHLNPYKEDGFSFTVKDFDDIAKQKIILDKNGKRKASEYIPAENFPEIISELNNLEIHVTKIIAVIYALYQKELLKRDSCDFDDLINKTVQIFKKNELLRTYYKQLYKHVIIDEFQDTNGSQLELIKLLLSDKEANITFVGDRKQSIYGFRFAQSENLEVLQKYAENKYKAKYEPVRLKYNYRSTPQVLEAVNYVTSEDLKLDEILEANPNGEFETIPDFVKYTPSATEETAENLKSISAKYIADEIIKLKNSDESIKYSDFAILVKSHNAAEIADNELSKYYIPCTKKVNTEFFELPVIQNVIALLRFAMNSRDETALYKILNIQLTEAQIYRLKSSLDNEISGLISYEELKELNLSEKILFLRNKNLFEKITADDETKKYTIKIFDTCAYVQKNKYDFSLIQLFYRLINEIKPYKKSGAEQYNCEMNLKIFEKIIADYSGSKNFVSVKMLLEEIEKYKSNRNFELPEVTPDRNAVQIMTIHASKGLEFPYTFVCASPPIKNAEKSSFCLDLQYGEKKGFGLIINKYKNKTSPKLLIYNTIWKVPRQNAEEARLFYVAVTRAKKYLNIVKFSTKAIDYVDNFKADLISKPVNFNEIKPKKQKPSYIDISNRAKQNETPLVPQNNEQTEYLLSFSKLNDFNRCRNLYLYKYKFKFPEISTKKENSLTGNIIHGCIYTGYINKKTLDETQMSELTKNIKLTEDEKKRINNLYKTFASSNYAPEKLTNETLYCEKSVDFIYKTDNKTVKFTGDIDLLIKNSDDTYSIIDFKTNKNIENSLSEYFKQLYIYKTALKEENINVKEAKLINLTEDEIKEYILTSSLENEISTAVKKEIEELISTTQTEIPEKTLYCKNCGYKYLCED